MSKGYIKMLAPAPKLLIISSRIEELAATDSWNVRLDQKSTQKPENRNVKRRRKRRGAKAKIERRKPSLERLPNEILILIFGMIDGGVATEVDDTAARVCLALTSKTFARLAMQIKIQLPQPTSINERGFQIVQFQARHPQSRWSFDPLSLAPMMYLLPSDESLTSQPRREDFSIVAAPYHKLMFALRKWMPAEMLYCVKCGRWKTRHDKIGPLFKSKLPLPSLTTTGGMPWVCSTCCITMKRSGRWYLLGLDAYDTAFLKERIRINEEQVNVLLRRVRT